MVPGALATTFPHHSIRMRPYWGEFAVPAPVPAARVSPAAIDQRRCANRALTAP